jgi:peptide/nickel transport system ATP-binding protein
MSNQQPLVEVQNLKVYFPIRSGGIFGSVKGYVQAVDDITFTINHGETLGLVGESGSGKTTVGRTILRVVDPTAGRIIFYVDGEAVDITALKGRSLRHFRHHMQLIFQDPYASLNPRMTVRDIIAEPLVANKLVKDKSQVDRIVREIAERCKLNVTHLRRFPHAFSGGQRQRIGIARALVANPEFIVCDESVSALDVSIQAEIINLLMDLQRDMGVTYLFIAHDLSVVAHIATRVAVMYVGELVELAPTRKLFFTPKHPYTEALLSAIPDVDPDLALKPVSLEGEIPNPANPPSGCRFHTRCSYAQDICRTDKPRWEKIDDDHYVACHFTKTLTLHGVDALTTTSSASS